MELQHGCDGGYKQKDVQEARVPYRWTICARGAGADANALMGKQDAKRRTFLNARTHDDGEKIVLGQKIRGGESKLVDG